MKFVDEVVLEVSGGKGGDGCVSFRREKFIPYGGPDGGNGGRGGAVFFYTDSALGTLIDYRYQTKVKAGCGLPGRGANCTGASGEDLLLPIPVGTRIFDEQGTLLADLCAPNLKVCVARGGRGGVGNAVFKSSTNRAPRHSIPGEAPERLKIRLELSLLADVGLLGSPNAGKSSLLSVISSARAAIGDYPFTTLHPQLGVVRVGEATSFVMADLPGLIAGASQGVGLGVRFLKHLSRCKLLAHVVDLSTPPEEAIARENQLLKELALFDETLSRLPRVLILNKIDIVDPEHRQQRAKELSQALLSKEGTVYCISTASREGLTSLCQGLWQMLEKLPSKGPEDLLTLDLEPSTPAQHDRDE